MTPIPRIFVDQGVPIFRTFAYQSVSHLSPRAGICRNTIGKIISSWGEHMKSKWIYAFQKKQSAEVFVIHVSTLMTISLFRNVTLIYRNIMS